MGWYEDQHLPTETLLGKTLVEVIGKPGDDEMVLTTDDGRTYMYYHDQDCCESVRIIDIIGDINDLVGSPLTMAEEVSGGETPEGLKVDSYDSYTWTFYKFATVKGYVTVRWLGESNGYYGEDVDLEDITPQPTQGLPLA